MLRPAEPGGWWMTIDRWQSEAAFSAFQAQQGAEYRRLDAELEGCAGEEVFVGAFEDMAARTVTLLTLEAPPLMAIFLA